jgi:hypothetical protein
MTWNSLQDLLNIVRMKRVVTPWKQRGLYLTGKVYSLMLASITNFSSFECSLFVIKVACKHKRHIGYHVIKQNERLWNTCKLELFLT